MRPGGHIKNTAPITGSGGAPKTRRFGVTRGDGPSRSHLTRRRVPAPRGEDKSKLNIVISIWVTKSNGTLVATLHVAGHYPILRASAELPCRWHRCISSTDIQATLMSIPMQARSGTLKRPQASGGCRFSRYTVRCHRFGRIKMGVRPGGPVAAVQYDAHPVHLTSAQAVAWFRPSGCRLGAFRRGAGVQDLIPRSAGASGSDKPLKQHWDLIPGHSGKPGIAKNSPGTRVHRRTLPS